jgi:hypothetical protein
MFDDFVDDEAPRVREPRPVLVVLPLVEQLVIETKPARLLAMQAAFVAEVRQCHDCSTSHSRTCNPLPAVLRYPRF